MGFFDTDLEFKGDKTIRGILQDFGNELQDDLIKSLQRKTNGTSKNLEQSIQFSVKREAEGYRFQLIFEDYGEYIDEGVRGVLGQRKNGTWKQKAPNSRFKFNKKKPPVNFSSTSGASLRQWSYNKGLNAYAVRESIFRQGIKPNHWFSDVVDENTYNTLVSQLEEIGAKQMELDLVKMIEGNGK